MPMLFPLAILATIVFALSANAEPRFFIATGNSLKEVKKIDAMKQLITSDNQTNVLKCAPVKIDEERGTVRNK